MPLPTLTSSTIPWARRHFFAHAYGGNQGYAFDRGGNVRMHKVFCPRYQVALWEISAALTLAIWAIMLRLINLEAGMLQIIDCTRYPSPRRTFGCGMRRCCQSESTQVVMSRLPGTVFVN